MPGPRAILRGRQSYAAKISAVRFEKRENPKCIQYLASSNLHSYTSYHYLRSRGFARAPPRRWARACRACRPDEAQRSPGLPLCTNQARRTPLPPCSRNASRKHPGRTGRHHDRWRQVLVKHYRRYQPFACLQRVDSRDVRRGLGAASPIVIGARAVHSDAGRILRRPIPASCGWRHRGHVL
jgi:hypothetical protein